MASVSPPSDRPPRAPPRADVRGDTPLRDPLVPAPDSDGAAPDAPDALPALATARRERRTRLALLAVLPLLGLSGWWVSRGTEPPPPAPVGFSGFDHLPEVDPTLPRGETPPAAAPAPPDDVTAPRVLGEALPAAPPVAAPPDPAVAPPGAESPDPAADAPSEPPPAAVAALPEPSDPAVTPPSAPSRRSRTLAARELPLVDAADAPAPPAARRRTTSLASRDGHPAARARRTSTLAAGVTAGGARSAGGPVCPDVEARVITESPDPAWSFASLASASTGDSQLLRVGQSLSGRRVASIEWDRVWLTGAGGRCAAVLAEGVRALQEHDAAAGAARAAIGEDAPDVAGTRALPDEQRDDASAWSLPEPVAAGIDRQSPELVVLSAATLDALLADGARWFAGLRLSPVEVAPRDHARAEPEDYGALEEAPRRAVAGQPGIRLDRVPVDSLLDRLGFEDGDVVLSLNGQPCESLERTARALATVKRQRELLAVLDRSGARMDLRVAVR